MSATWTGPSTTTLIFSWSSSSDAAGVAEYRIDVSADPGFAATLPAYENLRVPATTVSLKVTGLTPGNTYWARVRAVDTNGNVSANKGAVPRATLLTPDVTPPSVSISSPTAGQLITGNFTVWAAASDDVGVVQVSFYVDNVRDTQTAGGGL